KSVDLDAPLRGWEQYDCVAKYLRKPGQPTSAAKSTGGNPGMDAIKERLNDHQWRSARRAAPARGSAATGRARPVPVRRAPDRRGGGSIVSGRARARRPPRGA